MAEKGAEPTLDLSLLHSFSPSWSPELRLGLCIAVKYACHRLEQRLRACAISDASTAVTGLHHDNDGDAGGSTTHKTAAPLPPPRSPSLPDWQEYADKFLTATCQHLGVSEQSLPSADQITIDDALAIGLGKRDQEADDGDDVESRALAIDSLGSETASSWFRVQRMHHLQERTPPHTLRSDVASERDLISAEVRKEDQRVDDNVLEAVRARERGERSSDEDDGSDDSTPKAQPQVDTQDDAMNITPPPAPPQVETLPDKLPTHRTGGCLTDTDGKPDPGKEFEVLNDLLLIALGLGQFRSTKDGETTLFEQEALFGDTELAPAKPKEPSPPPSTGSDSAPSSSTPWSSIKQGATSSWNWTSAAGKKSGDFLQRTAASVTGNDSTSSQQKQPSTPTSPKPKQAVKPNEPCHYDARARAIIFVASAALGVGPLAGWQAEKAMAQTIFFLMNEARSAAKRSGKEDPLSHVSVSADDDDEQRTSWMNKAGVDAVDSQRKLNWKKWAVAGSGFAIGGAIIGLTGGLAAPLVVPTLAGLTGVTFLATSGGIIMLGTLFGVAGGGLASYRVHRRLRGLESFEFRQLSNPTSEAGLAIPSLHATICCSGLITAPEQQVDVWQKAFRSAPGTRDMYVVSSESALMSEAGNSLKAYVRGELISALGKKAGTEVVKQTALRALTALTLPLTVAGALGRGLDSLFIRAKVKAQKQGIILAETLRKEVQGHRPVVLVGTSLGSIAILSALIELAKDAETPLHLVDSVYLISTPSMAPSTQVLKRIRSLVSRRFVNVYSRNDMVCTLATWSSLDVSTEHIQTGRIPQPLGSRPVWDVPGLENVDVSDIVASHFDVTDGDRLEKVLMRAGVMHG